MYVFNNNYLKVFFLCGVSVLFSSSVYAQSLIYTPVNPSFGGSSFNSSYLLGVANAQNKYKDPEVVARQGTSSTDLFVRQLQSRLLSGLASQVTEAIFGDSPQESGTIVFGDQTITFSRGLENVNLVIEDSATGTRTEIEIPIFTSGDGTSGTTSIDLVPLSNTQSSSQSLLDPLNFNQLDSSNSKSSN